MLSVTAHFTRALPPTLRSKKAVGCKYTQAAATEDRSYELIDNHSLFLSRHLTRLHSWLLVGSLESDIT